MKVLLTGGAGYIGSHTAVELMNAGCDVVIADDLSNSCREVVKRIEELGKKTVRFYEIDVCSEDALKQVFSIKPPRVLHHPIFRTISAV